MGCWLSKKTEDPSLSSTDANKGKAKGEKNNSGGAGGESRDPPPTESPQPQEEKVKEVLSETPKITNQRSARSIDCNINVNNIDINGRAKRKTVVDDDEYSYFATIRSEVETSTTTSTTAASEQSTTATKTAFTDKKKKKKKKKKQPAAGVGVGAVAGGGREMRGSVVDVGCRSARSSSLSLPSALPSASPQLLIRAPRNLSSSGGNAGGGVMIRNKCNSNRSPAAPSPMKKISADLGERSRRRSVSPSPSASASASAIKRCASGANAAPVPAMDQRLCGFMSSSAATATATATATNRVNNGRYCSPRKIPATTSSRPVVDLVNGDRHVPAPAAANWSSGKLLEAPHPRPSPGPGPCPRDNHDHDQEESLENPLVSLECFIFL